MFVHIKQYVNNRVAHLARRLKRTPVIPVGEDRTAATEQAIQPASYTDGQTGGSARKRRAVAGFDQKVEMVRLNREVHDAKLATSCIAERSPDQGGNDLCSQARQSAAKPQCQVDGMTRTVQRTPLVSHPSPRYRRRLSPCSSTPASPRAEHHLHLLGCGGCHRLSILIAAPYHQSARRAMREWGGLP